MVPRAARDREGERGAGGQELPDPHAGLGAFGLDRNPPFRSPRERGIHRLDGPPPSGVELEHRIIGPLGFGDRGVGGGLRLAPDRNHFVLFEG